MTIRKGFVDNSVKDRQRTGRDYLNQDGMIDNDA